MTQAKHILIVENDPLLAANISRGLQNQGLTIAGTAASLNSAVQIMKKMRVDLAVIDIELDGPEDGVATAMELIKIKWIPIIYITGSTPLEVKDRLRKTFPAAFLEKPLRITELFVQIELALSNFQEGNLHNPHQNQTEHLFLPSINGYIGVKPKEILYIQAERIHSQLYLTEREFTRLFPEKKKNEPILVTTNKGSIVSNLPSYFFQLSRSLVINLLEIHRFDSSTIFLGKHKIPIPDGRRKDLMNILNIVKNQRSVVEG